MAVPVKTQIMFWGGALALFIGFIWAFYNVLAPFVLGIAVAYLLNPIVKQMDRVGIRRWISSLFILFIFIFTVVLIVVLIGPPVYRELSDLIVKIPDYVRSLVAMALPYIESLQARFGMNGAGEIETLLQDNAGNILNVGSGLLEGLATGGQFLAEMVGILLLTPLVSFFMMKEWPAIVAYVEDLYPQRHAAVIKDLLSKIDRKISGFVRGQLTIAVVLGLVYAITLSLLGLNYGFLIGIFAGIAGIIPLLGSTLGLAVSVLVAWFQSGEWGFTGIIAAVFIAGQVIEGNILTPKLIGDSVGLHPVWIIFSLLAGGSLFGITGMLLAVPVTAAAGVLIGYALQRYKESRLYALPVTVTAERRKNRGRKAAAGKDNG